MMLEAKVIIDAYSSGMSSINDAANRELQRRGDAAVEHASGLPPDVVAVLTQFDGLERSKEEQHKQSHIRFKDTVERFFNKLQGEENKYRSRMEELEVGLHNSAVFVAA